MRERGKEGGRERWREEGRRERGREGGGKEGERMGVANCKVTSTIDYGTSQKKVSVQRTFFQLRTGIVRICERAFLDYATGTRTGMY